MLGEPLGKARGPAEGLTGSLPAVVDDRADELVSSCLGTVAASAAFKRSARALFVWSGGGCPLRARLRIFRGSRGCLECGEGPLLAVNPEEEDVDRFLV